MLCYYKYLLIMDAADKALKIILQLHSCTRYPESTLDSYALPNETRRKP